MKQEQFIQVNVKAFSLAQLKVRLASAQSVFGSEGGAVLGRVSSEPQHGSEKQSKL